MLEQEELSGSDSFRPPSAFYASPSSPSSFYSITSSSSSPSEVIDLSKIAKKRLRSIILPRSIAKINRYAQM